MITLAAFYKDLKETKLSSKLTKRIKNNKIDYRSSLDMMQQTLLKTNPTATFTVKTCNETQLNYANVFRTNCTRINLIESFVKCDLNFVRQHYGKTIMVGSDHLVCGDLKKFFEEDYDFATCIQNNTFDSTHRTNVMNFMFINDRDAKTHKRLEKFFLRRYEIFKTFEEQDRLWWGDQKSLSVALNSQGHIQNFYDSNGKDNIFELNGLRIKLFRYPNSYITRPNREGTANIDESIIVDFAGDQAKKYVNGIFNGIMERT